MNTRESVAIVNLPGPSEPNDGEAELILVVEDEHEVRKVICLTLEMQGYRVLHASGPDEALELAKAALGPIDLMLTDVVMPACSGPELAAQLREHMPDLRVLYMSGYSEDAILDHGLSLSETAFLAKPFSSAALGRKVRQVLRDDIRR